MVSLRYIFAAFFLQGIAVTIYIYFKFGSSKAMPIMHLISLGIILVAFLSAFQIFIWRINSALIKKTIFAFSLGIFNFLLFTFYCLSIYGYFNWSSQFTIELFNAYVTKFHTLLIIAGIPFSLAISSALICLLSFFAFYFYLSKYVLIFNQDIQVIKPIKVKVCVLEISFKPIAWARIIALICLFFYVSTYKLWLSRDLFHIAVNNDWSLSNLAPSELFLNKHDPYEKIFKELEPNYRPIVLITVDALRADQMGVYGSGVDNTPFLSSLLRNKKLQKFDTAYSVCTVSFCGLLGILRSSDWSGLKKISPSITDVLKVYGYQTYFLLGGDHTNFGGLRKFYGDNIDFYRDGSVDRQKYPNDDFDVIRWVKEINLRDAQSSFLYIHLMSVHEAGLRHDDFKKWQPSSVSLVTSALSGVKVSREYELAYKNNYNNGILQADYAISEIFNELRKKGVLDNALVIISADHGEYLGELNHFGHGREPYEPVSRIPLLVYDPLNPRYPDRSLVSQVDIVPTFLHAIGVKRPSDWRGIPLQVKAERAFVSIASKEVSGVVALTSGKKEKYFAKREGNGEWLFDLDSTEGESLNLANLQHKQETLKKLRFISKTLSE
jgi:glucan phosphoethanolaminetransferase (alkaline phosphatase superfamily)